MTEDNFFDTFNRIHNPNYYYGKQKTKEKKTKEKKTEKKQKTRSTYAAKRHPIFKVSD